VELLAKDVLGSVFSSILDQGKMVNIDCGLLITHAERGVVKTKTFLIDSSVAEIRVDGSVDLGKESIQATIYPKQKGRLWDRVIIAAQNKKADAQSSSRPPANNQLQEVPQVECLPRQSQLERVLRISHSY